MAARTKSKLETAIGHLSSADAGVRKRGLHALSKLVEQELSLDDACLALEAAAGSFPDDVSHMAVTHLVRAAGPTGRPELADVVARNWPHYGSRARTEALDLLSFIVEQEGAETYAALCERVGVGDIEIFWTRGFLKKPRHGAVLFPRVLAMLDVPPFGPPTLHLLHTYLREGAIHPAHLASVRDVLLARAGALLDELGAYVEEGSAWTWEERYAERRMNLCGLLDVIGYLTGDPSRAMLETAARRADPRIAIAGAMGLLRHGEEPPSEALERVAGAPDVRNQLYDALAKLERLDLFPEAFRTQEAFAESVMARWLAFPTELGRAPDELELMSIYEREYANVTLHFYLYRFRILEPDASAEDGWLVGVSGPFAVGDEPSTLSYGATFSEFEPWGEESAEAYMAEVIRAFDERDDGDDGSSAR